MDLRDSHKKYGELDDGVISIKCSSNFCGRRPGVVVIHRWDALTGAPLEDQRFRDPIPSAEQVEEGSDYDNANPVAVRSS